MEGGSTRLSARACLGSHYIQLLWRRLSGRTGGYGDQGKRNRAADCWGQRRKCKGEQRRVEVPRESENSLVLLSSMADH